ncbi:hypothetical protein EDC94DRAFT_650622 [Helicostylum pulchrum]|nr:hypothetical protein EDC94DRAFT_650622 [Helicostylum pulchrum]
MPNVAHGDILKLDIQFGGGYSVNVGAAAGTGVAVVVFAVNMTGKNDTCIYIFFTYMYERDETSASVPPRVLIVSQEYNNRKKINLLLFTNIGDTLSKSPTGFETFFIIVDSDCCGVVSKPLSERSIIIPTPVIFDLVTGTTASIVIVVVSIVITPCYKSLWIIERMNPSVGLFFHWIGPSKLKKEHKDENTQPNDSNQRSRKTCCLQSLSTYVFPLLREYENGNMNRPRNDQWCQSHCMVYDRNLLRQICLMFYLKKFNFENDLSRLLIVGFFALWFIEYTLLQFGRPTKHISRISRCKTFGN